MTNQEPLKPEIAFYYPNPFWYHGGWIKNLLLFFDGIGLLVPDYMKERVNESDPALVSGLKEHDLLHIIEPEKAVDKYATEKLAASLGEIIASGALDPLTKETTEFHELSYSRLGGYGDEKLARAILKELKSKGLARDTEDGVSIPMHPMVRALVLVLLVQILRPYGDTMGCELLPATDRPNLVNTLCEILSIPSQPSAGHVVTFDLITVGVDLGPIPIDEILDFRREHFDAHRAYARSVRLFSHELSSMPAAEQQIAFEQRQAELDELAADLRRTSRKAWKKPASFALTFAGAAWTYTSGDPLGAVLAGAGALVGLGKDESPQSSAYSYLFSARERYA